MRLKIFLTCAFLIFSFQLVFSNQVAEEEAVKKVIRFETESFLKRESVAWKARFIEDENTLQMYAGNGFYYNSIGWNSFGPVLIQRMKQDPKPSRYTDIQHSDYIITVDTFSYSSSSREHIENLFNTTGYSFLGDNKINDAIEIFKLYYNLYPKVWNTYDSLGEGYALAGNKDLAIKTTKNQSN